MDAQSIREARLRRFCGKFQTSDNTSTASSSQSASNPLTNASQSREARESSSVSGKPHQPPRAPNLQRELDTFRAKWQKEIFFKNRAADVEMMAKRREREMNFTFNASLGLSDDEVRAKEQLAEQRKREWEDTEVQRLLTVLNLTEEHVQPWLSETQRYLGRHTAPKDYLDEAASDPMEVDVVDTNPVPAIGSQTLHIGELGLPVFEHLARIDLINASGACRRFFHFGRDVARKTERDLSSFLHPPSCEQLVSFLHIPEKPAASTNPNPRVSMTDRLIAWYCAQAGDKSYLSGSKYGEECKPCDRIRREFKRILTDHPSAAINSALVFNPMLSRVFPRGNYLLDSEHQSLYIRATPSDPPSLIKPVSHNRGSSWRDYYLTMPPCTEAHIYGFDAFHFEPNDCPSRTHTHYITICNPKGLRAGEVFDKMEEFLPRVVKKWLNTKDKEYGREHKLIIDRNFDQVGKVTPSEPRMLIRIGDRNRRGW